MKKGRIFGTICNGEIEIALFTDDCLKGVQDVLERSFFPYECVCVACEIDKPESTLARAELTLLCEDVTRDGVSLVAIETKTNKIVGFSFNKIQIKDEEPCYYDDFIKRHCQSPHAIALIQFMIDVDAKFDLFAHYQTECFFELMFLSTLPEFERRAIGRTLCEYSVQLANEIRLGHSLETLPGHLQRYRPKIVTANFSSRHSQRIGELLGFETLLEELYTDIQFNGQSYAERIGDPLHRSTTLVAKRLE